jgi:hypothetical protein
MDMEENESESWEMGVKQKMETPKRVKERRSEISIELVVLRVCYSFLGLF